MTDTQINAFLAVIQYCNFSKAAESLFISEPALSRSISLLEEELGCRLIQRKRGGRIQNLTEAGKHFLPLAEKWRLLMQESKNIAQNSESELLRVGATESFNYRLLAPVYQYFLKSVPTVRLFIDTLHTEEAYRRLAHNLFDLAFVSSFQESKHVESRPLFREQVVMGCPKGMYRTGSIHPSELNPSKEILSFWDPNYQAWGEFWFGQDSRSRLYAKTLANLPDFLIDNQMWAFMPISTALYLTSHYELEMHEVKDGPPDRICYVIEHRLFKHPKSRLFIDRFCEHVSAIEGIQLIT